MPLVSLRLQLGSQPSLHHRQIRIFVSRIRAFSLLFLILLQQLFLRTIRIQIWIFHEFERLLVFTFIAAIRTHYQFPSLEMGLSFGHIPGMNRALIQVFGAP